MLHLLNVEQQKTLKEKDDEIKGLCDEKRLLDVEINKLYLLNEEKDNVIYKLDILNDGWQKTLKEKDDEIKDYVMKKDFWILK